MSALCPDRPSSWFKQLTLLRKQQKDRLSKIGKAPNEKDVLKFDGNLVTFEKLIWHSEDPEGPGQGSLKTSC